MYSFKKSTEVIIKLNTTQFGMYKPAIKIMIYPNINNNLYDLYFNEFKLFYRGQWVNYKVGTILDVGQIDSISLLISGNNHNMFEIFIDKVYQKIPRDFKCQLTRDKFDVDDAELLLEQINPDLLNPFRENPFTKSLASFAMA
jgi:hypothetical protein